MLIVVTAFLGILRAWTMGENRAVVQYVMLASLMTLAFYPLFRIGTIGGGDVKLYAACGGFFPKDKILLFLFFSLLIAALFSLIRFLHKGDLKERFCYLISYAKEVADNGEWTFYWKDLQEKKKAGICLAGPILLSVLLYVGGFY